MGSIGDPQSGTEARFANPCQPFSEGSLLGSPEQDIKGSFLETSNQMHRTRHWEPIQEESFRNFGESPFRNHPMHRTSLNMPLPMGSTGEP